MRALFEQHPLRAGNASLRLSREPWRALVVAARGDKGRYADLPQPRPDVPAPEPAGRVPLAVSPQRLVDLPVSPCQSALHICGQRLDATDVPAPELGISPLPLRIAAGELEPTLDVFGEPIAKPARLCSPGLGRGRGRVERQGDQAGGPSQGVLDREHRAPRASEEMDPLEAKSAANGHHLVEEELQRP